LHTALSGWLVGLLAVGPAAAARPALPPRLAPVALSAATGPTVTVVAVPVDDADRAEAARLAYEAEGAVARSGRLTLVRLVDALAGREGEAKAAEAALAMREGQHAYDNLDTQQALQRFDKAVRAYEASDLSRHFGELIRARVMKAASQVANGENTAAQIEIRAVLSVEPRAQFSPNFFPPEQMAFIEKERKAALAAPRASLRVSTEPVPAQVYVNGQFRSVSPVELTDVAAADHYVTAVAPGYAVAQRRAREGSLALKLEPVPARQSLQLLTERVARKPDGKERDTALRELGALADVSQVLALLVRGGTGSAPLDVTALRLDVGDGHNLAYAPGTVPRGGGMAVGAPALLEPLVSADAPRQGGKPVTHFAGGGGRRTLGYVLMATGVALLAGGVYFGMEASAKQDEFQRTPQTSPRATELRDSGKTYALMADAGILVGVVSAGLGTYFALSGGGGSSAPSRASRATPVPAPKAEEPRGQALPMPPPPKATKPAGEALPMPPPPKATKSGGEALPMPPPPSRPSPAAQPAAEPPAPAKPADSRRARAEEERKRREAEEQRKQEEAAAKRREEEEAKRRQEAEAKRREEEEKRKREEEERRRREEEEKKKKRPALDEDDLRNY
jgi:hypothetical protein